MLALALTLSFACPPTADVDSVGPRRGFHAVPQLSLEFVGDQPASVERRPTAPPSFETLPLWDLDATLEQLEGSPNNADAEWLRWVIATSRGQSTTAHGALTRALASEQLSAARLAWWRGVDPVSLAAHDALIEAHDSTESAHTKMLLAATLAVSQSALSCPLELGPDGACRVPDSQLLVRRQPIGSERAGYWAAHALELRTKVGLDSEDLASAELFAELELAANADTYELLLATELPEDLQFGVDDWMRDSGVAHWERIYAARARRTAESRIRAVAFFESYDRCRATLREQHEPALAISVEIQTTVLLREATLSQVTAAAIDVEDRPAATGRRQHPPKAWGADSLVFTPLRSRSARAVPRVDVGTTLGAHATAMADRCVELGTTRGGDTEVIDGCRAILDAVGPDPDPLRELVPEPSSRSTIQHVGVVGPV